MSPSKIRAKTLVELTTVIRHMLEGIETLPLASLDEFLKDPRMIAAGESFLRRALEALLDLGRHVLAKGFGVVAPEYAAIADELQRAGVLSYDLAARLRTMARYRNRLVHFYDEVSPNELYEILTQHLGDFDLVLKEIKEWAVDHPEQFDDAL
jgi:uncharacterized protein YutE (UPF0331/DUF86 family)